MGERRGKDSTLHHCKAGSCIYRAVSIVNMTGRRCVILLLRELTLYTCIHPPAYKPEPESFLNNAVQTSLNVINK